MSDYDNTNTGILAANGLKSKDTDPTHKGSINIDGREYWLSAWVNEGKQGGKLAGKKYFSIKVQPKASNSPLVQQAEPRSQARARSAADDDIPF